MSNSIRSWISIFLLFMFTWNLFYIPGYADEPKSLEDFQERSSPEANLKAWKIYNELPEWVRRIYYGVKIESDRKPSIYFETVQPVWRLKEKSCLLFTQPRITIKDGVGYYSLGLGYRRLLGLDKVILGFNIFYDYQDEHHHRQAGFGAEALGYDLEARINSYFGTSHERLVAETTTRFEYEEVVDGLDGEIGIKVPGLSWMKVFAGGFYYDANYAEEDLEGWKMRLEMKPSRFFTIDIGVKDDNFSKKRWFMEVGFRLAFGGKKGYSSKQAEQQNVKKEPLYTRMLEPVERNFIPTLEKWTSDRTGTVTGRILDQNGDPVINARVEMHSEVVTCYTNSNGEFSAIVVAGNHALYAWNSDGDQLITGKAITVTDGAALDLGTEVVNDPAANHASIISNLTADPSTITGPPNKSWVRFDVTDVDGDDVDWSAAITGFIPEDPAHDDSGNLSPTSGTVQGGSGSKQVRYNADDDGTVTITVSLDDGNGGTDSDSVDIVVDH